MLFRCVLATYHLTSPPIYIGRTPNICYHGYLHGLLILPLRANGLQKSLWGNFLAATQLCPRLKLICNC